MEDVCRGNMHQNLVIAPAEAWPTARSVFLAGGVTGCPDWQSEFAAMVAGQDIQLFNPRRLTFDVTDSSQSDIQIEWEYRNLRRADSILFWFPQESLCPITLFELGQWSATHKRLFVGTAPDYPRRFDVVKQLSLARPDLQIVSDLAELARHVMHFYQRA